jgi:hypothetical protein
MSLDRSMTKNCYSKKVHEDRARCLAILGTFAFTQGSAAVGGHINCLDLFGLVATARWGKNAPFMAKEVFGTWLRILRRL